MRRSAALIVMLALASLALVVTGGGARRRAPALPPATAPYPAAFPAGDGSAIAEHACALCHSPMLVMQQAKDSTGWEKTLALMEKWGAPVTPAEHDTLRRWLVRRLGPRAR